MHDECISISCRNTERRGRQKEEDRMNDVTTTIMGSSACSYAFVYACFFFSPPRELSPFNPILRFSIRSFLFILFILRESYGPRFRFNFFCLFFFFFCCRHRRRRRRFALFSFCPFSRLRTGSLHSRASRVEGPRQGKPVSRVRVISPRRHARSSMTFRARTSRWCASDADGAPARFVDFFLYRLGSLEMHHAGCPSSNRDLRSSHFAVSKKA